MQPFAHLAAKHPFSAGSRWCISGKFKEKRSCNRVHSHAITGAKERQRCCMNVARGPKGSAVPLIFPPYFVAIRHLPDTQSGRAMASMALPLLCAAIASIDKGPRGSAGRKCPHTASKPLRIHKVFSAAFSLSASISAPAELLRIGQPWIFEGFLFFWTQAGCRPPRTKGQKAPKRLAVRRVCSC